MDKHLLELLCCPRTRTPVRIARRDEIDALNRAIAADGLVTVAGKPVRQAYSEALITRDGKSVYRVDDSIPVMLVDEAVSTTQLSDFPAPVSAR